MPKVAVVTGANKGLGYAIVQQLCEQFGGIVYLTSRDETRGKEACKRLDYKPAYHQLDITDASSIETFCSFIKREHNQIDILINNAGILFLKDATESKKKQAEQTLKVNFFALVNFCDAILPLMRKGGKIVNISSSSGHLSRIPSEKIRSKFSSPDLSLDALKQLMFEYLEAVKNGKEVTEGWGDSSYVVSKVAVNAYTFYLHRIFKEIVVNCVHPGYVISDMTRGSGNVTPTAAAKLPVKLALEPEGKGLYLWHNGQTVPWNGPDPRGYIDGKF